MFMSVSRDGKAGNDKATEISQEKAKFFLFPCSSRKTLRVNTSLVKLIPSN